jgi:polysaccharide biosynthesis protein PslG
VNGSRPIRSLAAPRAGLILACVLALIVPAVQASPLARAQARPRAHAASHLWIGVSDNAAALFHDPRFRWLGTHLARLVVPWDVVARPRELAWDAAWLQEARAQRVRPLVAFNADPSHPSRLPSVAAYGAAVEAFMRLFPWVRDYSTWNEENHSLQPTARDPRRAAQYFNLLSAYCASCSITAADVLDIPNMAEWVQSFLHWARHPRLWGLHSYVDVGRGSHERTSQLLRMVRGQVWFTEAGGAVWRWERPYGSSRATYIVHPETYAETLAHRLLALASISPRVTRVYYYQWRVGHTLEWARAHGQLSWDSGLLRPDCSPRPAFFVIARAAGRTPSRVPRARHNRRGECI